MEKANRGRRLRGSISYQKARQNLPPEAHNLEHREPVISNSRLNPIPLAQFTQRLQEPNHWPPSAPPPQTRESSPACHDLSHSPPGGGKAEPITRAQGCGLASSRTQRQPRPTATKRRRTCEALAPRDTIRDRRWVRAAPTSGASRIGLDQPMHC